MVQRCVTYILPRLDEEELHHVRSSLALPSLFRPFSFSANFLFFTEASYLGPWGSDAVWLKRWLTISQHSKHWWRLFSRVVLGRSADACGRINACFRAFDTSLVACIENAFRNTTCPAWIVNSLVSLVERGKTSDSTDLPDLQDTISLLEARFKSGDRSDATRGATLSWFLALSDRHLRDLIRRYQTLPKAQSLADQLEAYLIDDEVGLASFTISELPLILPPKLGHAPSAQMSLFHYGVKYTLQHVIDGALDSARRDACLLISMAERASKMAFPPLLQGSPGPYHILLIIILQLHWDDSRLRAIRNSVVEITGTSLNDLLNNVVDADVRAYCLALLQPRLTNAPFDPDGGEAAEETEEGWKELPRPALALEQTLERSISALGGVDVCLWLRTWIKTEGLLRADCTLHIQYDPYQGEGPARWRALQAEINDKFEQHGVKHYNIDLQVPADNNSSEVRPQLLDKSRSRHGFEGYDLVFQGIESQVTRIQRAWRRHQLRKTILQRRKQRTDPQERCNDSIVMVQKVVIIQRWWRKLKEEIEEDGVEALIQRWTSIGKNNPMRPAWFNSLSTLSLFVQAHIMLCGSVRKTL